MQANYRFRFDLDHLVRSTQRYQQTSAILRGWSVLRYVIAIPIAALAWFCWLIRENTVASLCTAAVISLLFTWPLQKLAMRYRFRKSPFGNEDVTVGFDHEGVHVKGSLQDTRLTWAVYTRARRFKDGMLLFQGPQLFSWMPDAGAADSTSVANLRELARSRVRDYREV
ncbi:MAG TPA: hypothetical protein VFZ95_03310 [Steroidobacteraceae bacterium]